jgi:hypothetical protein
MIGSGWGKHMEDKYNQFDLEFLNAEGRELFASETASMIETSESFDSLDGSTAAISAEPTADVAFEHVLSSQQEKWHAKIRKLDYIDKPESKQNSLLIEQIKRYEEKNAILSKQFVELFDYSESVYQFAESKRKDAELRAKEARAQAEKLRMTVAQTNADLAHAKKEILAAEEKAKYIAQDNVNMSQSLKELKARFEKQETEESAALTSLTQGKQLIDSAVRAMGDFQTSFQAYVTTVERDGVTPITIRAAKIFAEHWRIQGDDLTNIAKVLVELARK